MKNLLLIFLFLSIGCGQTPLEKDKEKGVMANILVPTANFFRTTSTPSDDATAAANHATKLAYIKSLPLYDVSAKTAAELKVLSLDGIVESAEVPTDGKPSIKFYVATKATSSLPASRLVGFGWTTKATTVPSGTTRFASNLTTVSNINFTIAKYVEGTNGSPGKWVNYIVTTPEVTAGSDGTTTYTRSRAFSLPTNDNEGTITEDKVEGSYTYKFSRNIITSKDFIKSTYGETRTTAYTKTKTLSAVSSTKQANLGDLTYNASLPHRVIVYLGTGNVRGTSTNNTNGTDTATGVTTVNFDDGETLAYDFIPETKAIKALQRDITNTEKEKFRANKISFIFQHHLLLPDFTALENVMIPLLISKMNVIKAKQEAIIMLQKVGLGERLDSFPSQLSGGESARVGVARALVSKKQLVLADEPTGNLDRENSKNLMALILELQRDLKFSMVLVTHDMELAAMANKRNKMLSGKLQPITANT